MNTRTMGEIAELQFCVKAVSLGFHLSKPFRDTAAYDYIVDYAGKLSRVQIKSTSTRSKAGTYRIIALHGNNKTTKRTYNKKRIDFLVIYIKPIDTWYIIPIEEIAGCKTLGMFPHKPHSNNKYEKYKESWNLFK